jgi:hypothetical protein
VDRFDLDIDRLCSAAAPLSHLQKALLFAASAKRLTPLYWEYASLKKPQGKNKYDLVLTDIRLALINAGSISSEKLKEHRKWIYAATPDEDSSLLASVAQEACICLYVSVSFLLNDREANIACLDDCISAVKVVICYEKTGYIDVPDNSANAEVATFILEDERYQKEIESIRSDIQACRESRDFRLTVDALWERAACETWDYSRKGSSYILVKASH